MKITRFEPIARDDVHKYRKESSFYSELALIDTKQKTAIVTVRFYGTGSRAYCCVWVHHSKGTARGGAWAGGYGYHKPSEAMAGAMKACGFELSESIGGRGDSAMIDALEAIARHFGLRTNYMIHKSHA